VTTVRTHLNRVYDKLAPGSRLELALYAAQRAAAPRATGREAGPGWRVYNRRYGI
jgi:hypothetical protein